LIIINNISASEQYPDLLIYNGNEYEIDNYPIESYFEIYPNVRPGNRNRNLNSALLRGYRARYEIINNELILINIETMGSNGNWIIINNRNIRNRIKINTFTGRIGIPNGGITWVFIGFTPIYENYIILEIENGDLKLVYNENCYEYLQSILKLHENESREYNYILRKLEELYNRN